ncbi:alpha-L-fucosidase [soil metagenome]
MNNLLKRIALLLIIFIAATNLYAQEEHKDYTPDPDTAIRHRLEEWQDLKFGLLMHWGPYSQWGVVESWSICPEDLGWATGGRKPGVSDSYAGYVKEYEKLKTTFNPTQFDPSKWAAAAKDAGMKYVVFTTKHHDGFCMFDTKYTDYKVTDTGCAFSSNPKKNITKEIFDAFRQKQFWVGAYFSKPDWHSDYYWWKNFPPSDRNPSYSVRKYPGQWNKFVNYTHSQVNELMSDYGKIDILWLDGGWVRTKTDEEIKTELLEVYENSRWARNPQSQDINMALMVKEARQKQPELIVVDRAVPGQFQNYLTPEQHIPETGLPYPWETCMTMANSWSYVPNDVYKSTDELVEKLVDIVSKGGNLLLNIGPGPDGQLDPQAYNRLEEIGAWMKTNGESIYGSRMCKPFGEGDKIRFTQSKDGKTHYIFLFDAPAASIAINKIPFKKGAKLSMLGYTKTLKWKATSDGALVSFPAGIANAGKQVWVLKLQHP